MTLKPGSSKRSTGIAGTQIGGRGSRSLDEAQNRDPGEIDTLCSATGAQCLHMSTAFIHLYPSGAGRGLAAGRSRSADGFCLGGCLLFLVVALLIAGAVLWGGFSAYQGIYQMTSPRAQTFEPIPATAQQNAAGLKWGAFEKALVQGAGTEFRFSADDLNACFFGEGRNADLVSHLRFRTIDDWIVADVSVPLDFMAEFPGLPSFRHRFFNGKIGARLAVEKNELKIKGLDIVGNGHRLPWLFTGQGYRDTVQKTLEQGMRTRLPQGDAFLTRLESIHVENGEIVVKVRPAG